MSGTFHSQVTRGHVGRDPLLTGRRSYLGLFRGQGLRVLVRDGDDTGWQLLDLPSAWCIGLDACRWWYATPDGRLIEVSLARARRRGTSSPSTSGSVRGPATRLLVTLDTGSDGRPGPRPRLDRLRPTSCATRTGWSLDVEPATAPGSCTFDADRRALGRPAARTSGPASPASLDSPSTATPPRRPRSRRSPTPCRGSPTTPSSTTSRPAASSSTPAAAGARATSARARSGCSLRSTATTRSRDVLLRVMRAQNARGDWPQAFEFLPPTAEHGQQDSHGDVVYWPRAGGRRAPARRRRRRLLDRRRCPSSATTVPPQPAAVEEHLTPGGEPDRGAGGARDPAARPTATATGTTPSSPPTPTSPGAWPRPGRPSSRCRHSTRSPQGPEAVAAAPASPTRAAALAARTREAIGRDMVSTT